MRYQSSRGQRGFTLIEILISMAIFVLIMVGMLEMFDFVRLSYVRGERKLDVQQNARLAMDTMAREFRMAGYFPENYDTSALNNLPVPLKKIHIAAGNGLAVAGDLDGSCINPSGGACPGDSSKVFLYCLSGTTVIRKITTFSGGSDTAPASGYKCNGGVILAENVESLTFAYYDANNALLSLPLDGVSVGSNPNSGPFTDRNAARTVLITLQSTENVPGPGQPPQTFTLTQSVRLRNLND